MPELNLKEKVVQRRAAIAYGDEFIINDFPIDDPYIGALSLPQKPQTESKFKFWIMRAGVQEDQKIHISDWHGDKDPFTQADLLNIEEDFVIEHADSDVQEYTAFVSCRVDNKDPHSWAMASDNWNWLRCSVTKSPPYQVQELIFQIRRSLSIRYHESLANRLLTLFNDAKEEDSTSVGIEVGSLRNFYNFLLSHTDLKCPAISLTPDNDIYASWREEQNQVFTVHFLPDENVRFVIFKPNDKHPERKIRLSGTATADTLIETVASSGVWDWISDER